MFAEKLKNINRPYYLEYNKQADKISQFFIFVY
jgi:hypothetical protein